MYTISIVVADYEYNTGTVLVPVESDTHDSKLLISVLFCVYYFYCSNWLWGTKPKCMA